MILIDACVREGIPYENLNAYGVREMDLFLRGVSEIKKDQQRMTRRLCFTFAKVMGAEISKESDLWAIDESENCVDVSEEKVEYFTKKLKELGKWKS